MLRIFLPLYPVLFSAVCVNVFCGLCPGTAAADTRPIPSLTERTVHAPQVLTRGPLHEAYAAPVTAEIIRGLLVPNEPPLSLRESEPAAKPADPFIQWIPGYWAWDDETRSYLWVTGCWRIPPPDHQWVPGYWSRASEGWEWTSGYWGHEGTSEPADLPIAPPPVIDFERLQAAPPRQSSNNSEVQPTARHFWVQPCWYWYENRYAWRRGYWELLRPGWSWMPSHYIRTPRGYYFVRGYWDYSFERRGVLFAPVRVASADLGRSDVAFTPNIVLRWDLDAFGLFVRPRYGHYYFGDYYDLQYTQLGMHPWFDMMTDPTWAAPEWTEHSTSREYLHARWTQDHRYDFSRRRADPALRPPRTYEELLTRQSTAPPEQRLALKFAQPLAMLPPAPSVRPPLLERGSEPVWTSPAWR